VADRTWTGATLEQALREGSLDRGAEVAVVCMVKTSEHEGHISISAAGCERWADVPADMIESAELVGHRACREHQHPLVRLIFKQPRGADAQIFGALVSQLTQTRAEPTGVPSSPFARPMGMRGLPSMPSRLRIGPGGGVFGGGGRNAGWRDCWQTCLEYFWNCCEYHTEDFCNTWVYAPCVADCPDY
jgi:hypothetical protein